MTTLQPEERAHFEILKAQMFAERAAKRERRPKRARVMVEEETSAGQKHITTCYWVTGSTLTLTS